MFKNLIQGTNVADPVGLLVKNGKIPKNYPRWGGNKKRLANCKPFFKILLKNTSMYSKALDFSDLLRFKVMQ